ncbi:NYN domain-containing protein [Arthrobacter sp. TMS1-12-1]
MNTNPATSSRRTPAPETTEQLTSKDAGRQALRQQTPGRTLFVIDIENMVGSGTALTAPQVGKVQIRINAAVTFMAGDHTVIASNQNNAAVVCFTWKGPACRKIRSGKDGADQALLEDLNDPTWVASHYDHVVIASGDHAFANTVAAIKSAGCPVTVIAPNVGLSKRMRLAAGPDLVPLGSPFPTSITTTLRTVQETA